MSNTTPLYAKVPGQDIWLTNQKPKGNHLGAYARKRAWAVDSQPDGQEVDLLAVASTLDEIENKVNEQFVDRERLAEAIKLALVSGQHIFVKSLPGTAKTALAESYATALNGKVDGHQFGIDSNKDEIIGGYDPNEAAQGRWVRVFDKLAVSDIFIADEIWESPSEITNLLKSALNEAEVERVKIPLKTCMAMSNVLPADYKTSADYDRFLIRLTLDYIADGDDFEAMLTALAGDIDIDSSVSMDDILILSAVGQYMAKQNASREIVTGMREIWERFKVEGIVVSDRRWTEAYKLAYAWALAQGDNPSKAHLMVCQYALWVDPQDESRARRIIFEVADKWAAARLGFEANLEEFGKLFDEAMKAYQNFDPADQDARVNATTLAMQLETDLDAFLKLVKNHSTESAWQKVSKPIIDTVEDTLENIETLMLACRKKTVDRPDPLHDGQGLSRRRK